MTLEEFIPHNLPERNNEFVNRENEIKFLENYLLSRKFRYISISGEGGIGKTSLAIEFAHSIVLKTNAFESVVWVTPKKLELVSQKGFLNVFNPKIVNKDVSYTRIEEGVWVSSIDDLYSTILEVSRYGMLQDELPISVDINEVIAWMKVHKILLIIDDLDSWDWGEILNFVEKIPPDSAVIITSRRIVEPQYLPGVVQINLNSLSLPIAFELINKKSKENDINLSMQNKRKIYDFSEGNPLILQLMISLVVKRLNKIDLLYPLRAIGFLRKISVNNLVDNIIDALRGNSEARKFLFDDLYKHLTPDEKTVLLAIAVLQSKESEKPNIKKLEAITSFPLYKLQKVLKELSNSSLIQMKTNNPASFYMHDYISNFVLNMSLEETEVYQEKVKNILN